MEFERAAWQHDRKIVACLWNVVSVEHFFHDGGKANKSLTSFQKFLLEKLSRLSTNYRKLYANLLLIVFSDMIQSQKHVRNLNLAGELTIFNLLFFFIKNQKSINQILFRCDGNANNFKTKSDCMSECSGVWGSVADDAKFSSDTCMTALILVYLIQFVHFLWNKKIVLKIISFRIFSTGKSIKLSLKGNCSVHKFTQ